MTDLTGNLDCFTYQKFKKSTGYDAKLTKLINKTKKFKSTKAIYEVKSAGNSMRLKPLGKKSSPVNEINYDNIRDLKKSSPAEKTIGFAYPGLNQKAPVALFAMRFQKEAEYNKFTERMETPHTDYQNSESQHPSTRGSSHYTERQNNNREKPPHIPSSASDTDEVSKKPKKGTGHSSRRYSEQIPTSSSSSSTTKGRSRTMGATSYISTDNILSPHQGRSRSTVLTLRSPFETTYISTKSTIRESPSPFRRAYSSRHCNNIRVRKIYRVSKCSSYSSSCSSSSSSTDSSSSSDDYSPLRARYAQRRYSNRRSSSRSSSSDSSSSSGSQSISESMPGARSFVISRCSRGKKSGFRCQPVGKITITPDTPSFAYKA